MSRPTIFSCISLCVCFLLATDLVYAEHNYPGGIVAFSITKESSELPEVRYGTREPIVIERARHWHILVGLSLETLPGEYLIYIKRAVDDSRAFVETFNVEQKNYSTLSGNRQAKNIYAKHTVLNDLDFKNTDQPTLPLRYPVESDWIKRFGQVLNTKSEEVIRQNLISTVITNISTVVAPQNAIVSRIETDEFDISTLFLDHGRGLYSVIRGVTDLSIETGNGVMAGAVLGKSPVYEGRNSTISWQVIMNGVYVNPVLLVEADFL